MMADAKNCTGREGARKMCAAIVASCLVHSGAFLLPHLGTSADAGSPPTHAAGLPYARISARLASAQPGPFDEPRPFVAGQNTAFSAPSGNPTTTDEHAATLQRSGLGLLPIEGNIYYASSQLTQRPVALNEFALDDSAVAPVVASGKMVMTLWINAQGAVEEAVVDDSELPGLFAGPIIEAFKRLRFTPGALDGRSVGTIMKIEVIYEDGRAAGLPPTKVFSGDAVVNP